MRIIVVNGEGQTIHVTFNFNLHGKPQSAQPTIKNIENFVGLHLLIIEEVSTCAQTIIESIDAHLKQLKECPNITTSGMHTLYYGDWLQLGPIVGPTLFTLQKLLKPK